MRISVFAGSALWILKSEPCQDASSLRQFLLVFVTSVPSIHKLNPKNTVIDITVAKHILAVTSAYAKIVIHLIMQSKAEISNIEIFANVTTIDF